MHWSEVGFSRRRGRLTEVGVAWEEEPGGGRPGLANGVEENGPEGSRDVARGPEDSHLAILGLGDLKHEVAEEAEGILLAAARIGHCVVCEEGVSVMV
jgi:hypothetical protein